jgi:two-component system, LytTR family, response regulator
MRRLRAIIVDDERLARVNLKRLLESYPEIEIVGEAHSCRSAIEVVSQYKPQLIFLDVQLRGETGFDLLEELDRSIKIIFVTAFDEFAVRAFEVNAADYLLKPVNPDRLKVALDRIINNESEQISVTKQYEYSDSIYVHLSNSTSKFVKINSISLIVPVGNYSRIEIVEGKHYLVQKTLKQWEEELPDRNFVRIHRSSIINIEHVDRIERHSKTQHRVYLKQLSEPLEASRRYASKLKTLE